MRSFLMSLLIAASIASAASAQEAPLLGVVIETPMDAPLPPADEVVAAPIDEAPLEAPRPQLSTEEIARMRTAIHRELLLRRRTNLARFERYVRAEVYPLNSYQPGYVNVMIDDEGHICAAATIMTMDGLGELVRTQAAENNFLRLADVHDGAIYEWILTSGFMQEELAAIQAPFVMPEEPTISPEQQREQEKIRLRAVYSQVLMQLRADRATSLEVATDRLLAHRLAAS